MVARETGCGVRQVGSTAGKVCAALQATVDAATNSLARLTIANVSLPHSHERLLKMKMLLMPS